jgi:hypothetical protein
MSWGNDWADWAVVMDFFRSFTVSGLINESDIFLADSPIVVKDDLAITTRIKC